MRFSRHASPFLVAMVSAAHAQPLGMQPVTGLAVLKALPGNVWRLFEVPPISGD